MRVGILGYGEIGSSIEKLYLGRGIDLAIYDPNKGKSDDLSDTNVLNICIPYNDIFVDTVVTLIDSIAPSLVVIHSTVAPGTTDWISKLVSINFNGHIVYSPVRGNHPNLYYSLKTFIKYVGANTKVGYDLAAEHFTQLNVCSEWIGDTITAELAKLLCTTYYGVCIAWHEEMKRICDHYNVSFESAVTNWTKSYNDGYRQLGMSEVIRPVLYPPGEKIGGHCVIPNAEILNNEINSTFLNLILKFK